MHAITRRAMVFVVVLGFALALVPGAPAALQGPEVRIGVITSITGFLAAFGKSQEAAALIAQEEINAAGGIGGVPLKLIIYDNATKPEEAINLTRKLVEEKVLAIIGPFGSHEAEVSFPVANRLKIVSISPTASKVGLTGKNRPWAFTLFTTSDRIYAPMVDRWIKDTGVKTVALINDTKDFIAKFDAELIYPPLLKERNIPIVETVTYVHTDLDYSGQVTKILAKKPEGVVVSANYADGAGVVRELRKQGFKGPVIGGVGLYHPQYLATAGPAADGTYTVSTFWLENPDPKSQKYVTKYKAKTGGKDPESTGAHMYDVIYALKQVIEKGGVTNKPADLAKDRDRIRRGLQSLTNFAGVTGSVSINADGDAVRPTVFILRGAGGKFERL